MFGAEPIDDLSAGGHHIPECPASDPIFEDLDRLCRKAIGKCRERLVEDDAHHLPMTGHRILPRRRLRHPPVRLCLIGCTAVAKFDDAAEPERAKIRNSKRDLAGDVTERVAALIAVGLGVRQLTAADAVEHDQDDTGKRSQVRDVSMVAMACLNAM